MKDTPKLILELLVTIIVAGLISLVVAVILGFIAGNLNMGEGSKSFVEIISAGIFGFIVGYKGHSLVKAHKK